MARICVSKRQYWACNSINQERRSHSSALVLANRIQMCASGNFSFRFSRFSFHCRSEERSSPFLSSHEIAFATFSFSFPFFPYWVRLDFPFSSFITWRSSWCWSSFRSILSQHFLSFSRRDSFFLPSTSYPCSPKAAFTDLYRMRGLTDFARTAPIGKKSYWKFPIGWRLFFLPSASSIPQHSLSQSVFFCALVGPVI